MARRTIGNVLKGKDGKGDYIQIRKDLKEPIVLTAGSYLNLESKKQQLESLEAAVAAGKLKPEYADKTRERLEKMPDFIRFEIIQVTKE